MELNQLKNNSDYIILIIFQPLLIQPEQAGQSLQAQTGRLSISPLEERNINAIEKKVKNLRIWIFSYLHIYIFNIFYYYFFPSDDQSEPKIINLLMAIFNPICPYFAKFYPNLRFAAPHLPLLPNSNDKIMKRVPKIS